MRTTTTTLLFALACSTLGQAGHCLGQDIHCKTDGNQMEMNACAAQDLAQEDAQLNTVYKTYIAKLDADHLARLKTVQLNWIKFRDSACDYEAADSVGGSMHPMELDTCLATYTKQRREELEALLNYMN